MAVSLATITNLAIAVLTPGAAYGTLGDARFFSQQFTDTILTVDGNIVKLILGNPSHGRRSTAQYVNTISGFLSGAQLPPRIGPIESVQFAISGGEYGGQTLIAKEYPPEAKDWINQDNQNPGPLITIKPKYCLEGVTLYHNAVALLKSPGTTGVSVNVSYTSYTRTTACQAPDEYFDAVLAGTLAMLFDVEGENAGSAQRFGQMYQLMELAITTGQPTIPQFRYIEQLKARAAGEMEQG